LSPKNALNVLFILASISSFCQAKGPKRGPKRGPLVCLDNAGCINWGDFKKNISNFSLTNTKIQLSSEAVYNLAKQLEIKNASNVSLVCNGTSKEFATINCTQKSMLVITGSVSMTIKNIVFIKCGSKFDNKIFGKKVFPKTTAAAMVFYNVSSVKVIECLFVNSYGHGIVGLNVVKNFNVKKVKFKQNASTTINGSARVFQGGILLYMDKSNRKLQLAILIKQCNFIGIKSMWTNLLNNSGIKINHQDVNSAVLGVVSYQHNASIKIEILETMVNNITSRHGALINGYFSIINKCSIQVTKCSFNNNTVTNNSIINVHFLKGINSTNDHTSFVYNMSTTFFQNNTAKNAIVNITALGNSGSNQKFVLRSVNLYHSLVEGALLYIRANKPSHTQLDICNSTFTFNSVANGSGLVIISISNFRFAGRNTFYNNSIHGSVIILNETKSIFEGVTNFSFNQAVGILSIHNYTTLLDGATLNISNNFNNASQTDNAAPILVTVNSSHKFYPCYFQFAFSNGTTYDNLKDITMVVIQNANKGYKQIAFGSRLDSCYWLENSSCKKFSPEMVFKRAIEFGDQMNII